MRLVTQRLALPYFQAAVGLFILQVIAGLLGAAQYVWPGFLYGWLNFNTLKEMHLNLLVVWLLFGFMGATYYIVPEEAQAEVYSPLLARVQFWLFLATGVVALAGFALGHTTGRKFLELPRPLAALVVIVILLFLFNVFMTIRKGGRWTSVLVVLVMGLVGAAAFYIPGQIPLANESMQLFYRWWTVHLWVEGVWELIMGAVLGYLLLKLTGIDREVVEKWLYVIIGLALFTGILGTGHHYYWIGTPRFWLTVGGIFSGLEPLSFLGMMFYALQLARVGQRHHPNRVALAWTIGCAVVAFLGAGVLGLAHTFPPVNRFTHGTQITASHGHLAFFGAYAMLNLAIISYALPELKSFREMRRAPGSVAMWTMIGSMFGMTFALLVAGVLQTYFERIGGLDYFTAQAYLSPWYTVRLIFGLTFLAGLLIYGYEFWRALYLAPPRAPAGGSTAGSATGEG